MFGFFLCCTAADETNPPLNSNLALKPRWKGGTGSLRGHLVRTYDTDIEKDFYIDRENELGKGGCGVVIVGEHKETRAQYAIKIVNKSTAERGRLDRELKLMKDVDHTNIVRLFSVYDVPGNMYFVMELCLGGHLGNLLARQSQRHVDESWAKKLCRQILSAVAHIHQRGIAHRDIKLQNILIDSTNDHTAQVKLIDFGYGSRYVGALPMRTKCGTPYTTAPEVIRECYDERCDIWSCGVVLYIMLCGRRPFEALDIAGPLSDAGKAAMITNILAGRYHFNHKPFQTVTKTAITFVKTLLHQDYKTRIRAYEALEHPWFNDNKIINSNHTMLTSAKSFHAINNIRKSMEVSDMQRTGMFALVFGINARSAHDLRQIFQSFDSDGSGTISKEEFNGALKMVCPELTPEDLNRLFDIVDIDKNQTISFTEFLAATLDPREVDIEELNKAFKLLDEDGNGFITKDELTKVVKLLLEQQQVQSNNGDTSSRHIANSQAVLEEEVESKVNEIFAQVDVNNDGSISHAEFFLAMTGMNIEANDDDDDTDSQSANQMLESSSSRRHSTGHLSPNPPSPAPPLPSRSSSQRHSIGAIRMSSQRSSPFIHTVVEASESSKGSGTYVSQLTSQRLALPSNADFQETSPSAASPRPNGNSNLVFYDANEPLEQHSGSEGHVKDREPSSPSINLSNRPLSFLYTSLTPSSSRRGSAHLPTDHDEKSEKGASTGTGTGSGGMFQKSSSFKNLGVDLGGVDRGAKKRQTSFKRELSNKFSSERSNIEEVSEERVGSDAPPMVKGLSSSLLKNNHALSGAMSNNDSANLNAYSEHSEGAEQRGSIVSSLSRIMSTKSSNVK